MSCSSAFKFESSDFQVFGGEVSSNTCMKNVVYKMHIFHKHFLYPYFLGTWFDKHHGIFL